MNNCTLTLGSLFDGSGGFPLGGVLAGIQPKWTSEIEPFPVRVTQVRFPEVKHYGDVSALDGSKLPPVDIITFGSPCQDMSVAGKRSGLDGGRSSLFYEAVRIVKEMRGATDGEYPRYIVWENVPGAFSSNRGQDFRTVLEEICKIKDPPQKPIPLPEKWEFAGEIVGDEYSVAWRVFDAQFWGVPQRRKRIYLVADFAGWSAGKVLFESEGLSGYSAESFRAWQRTACRSKSGTEKAVCDRVILNDQGGNRMDVSADIVGTLRAEAHHPPIVLENHPTDSRVTVSQDGMVQTLTSRMGTGGNNCPMILQDSTQNAVVFGVCSKNSNSMKSDNPHSGFYEADTARCLDANGGDPSCNQGGMVVVEGNGSRPSHSGDGYKEADVMYTLNATEVHAVAFGIDRAAYNQGKNAQYNFAIDEEVCSTLVAKGPSAVGCPVYTSSRQSFFTEALEGVANTPVASDYKGPPIVNDEPPDYIVRRLTPTECARLQGFPDWWCDGLAVAEPTEEDIEKWAEIFETHRLAVGAAKKPKTRNQIIKWLKNPHSDASEYKMWGNGVALPNVVFVLSGIVYWNQQEN